MNDSLPNQRFNSRGWPVFDVSRLGLVRSAYRNDNRLREPSGGHGRRLRLRRGFGDRGERSAAQDIGSFAGDGGAREGWFEVAWDKEAQLAKDREALANPRPGDAWHEMYTVLALVCQVKSDAVFLCRNPYADRQEAEWVPLNEFQQWPKYGNIDGQWDSPLANNHWCHLFSRKHFAYIHPHLRSSDVASLNIHDRTTEAGAMHAAMRDWHAEISQSESAAERSQRGEVGAG